MLEEYENLLKFKDQSPSFANGFICGQIYAAFERGDFSPQVATNDTFAEIVGIALLFNKRTVITEGDGERFKIKFETILRVVKL